MGNLDDATIRTALAKLGERLVAARPVEVLLIGGAAGVLTGELPPAWTTADVDLISCHLPQDREAVLAAAAEAGRELSMPTDWLNDWCGLYAWALPDDWKSRGVKIGQYGSLTVYAVGRLDLIATKFLAHRTRDLEHLQQLGINSDDLKFVRAHLDGLAERFPM